MKKEHVISKEDILNICITQNYSRKNAAKYFNVSEKTIAKHLKQYNLNKFQEKVIDKDELYNFYITQNHTLDETMAHFNISKTCLCSKLKKYGIKKDPASVKRESQKIYLDKNEIIHYYIDLNYTLTETAGKLGCSCKVLTRRLKEFDIKKDTDKRYINVSNSCFKNHGVSSPVQLEEVKRKIRKTNLNKYGVPYACMREEFHKFKGSDSQINLDFAHKLDKLGIKYEREFNLENYLYDFKVENTLIELDPTITHNSSKSIYKVEPKDKNYHYNKSLVAKKYGYQCIHIFDWDDVNKIINLFLLHKDKVYARKCKIKEISKPEADYFLEQNHLQGSSKGNVVNIGLFDENGTLIEVMTFGKPRYNKNYQWELLRLCSNKSVIGGGAKMLKYFEGKYNPRSLLSYCDTAKFDGNIYKELGFELLRKSKPQKHWCCLGKGKRQHITDNLLRQHGFDQLFGENYGKGTSNEKLMLENNYVVVYDCGQETYIKNNCCISQ